MIAKTPNPPYYAVIFTSTRTEVDDGYWPMAQTMEKLASEQPGFLGLESVAGITISYWTDEAAIAGWRQNAEHRVAQTLGREKWYSGFAIRVARVERAHGYEKT